MKPPSKKGFGVPKKNDDSDLAMRPASGKLKGGPKKTADVKAPKAGKVPSIKGGGGEGKSVDKGGLASGLKSAAKAAGKGKISPVEAKNLVRSSPSTKHASNKFPMSKPPQVKSKLSATKKRGRR